MDHSGIHHGWIELDDATSNWQALKIENVLSQKKDEFARALERTTRAHQADRGDATDCHPLQDNFAATSASPTSIDATPTSTTSTSNTSTSNTSTSTTSTSNTSTSNTSNTSNTSTSTTSASTSAPAPNCMELDDAAVGQAFAALVEGTPLRNAQRLEDPTVGGLFTVEHITKMFRMSFNAGVNLPNFAQGSVRREGFVSFADRTKAEQTLRFNAACAVFGFHFPRAGPDCMLEAVNTGRGSSSGDKKCLREDYELKCYAPGHIDSSGRRIKAVCGSKRWYFSLHATEGEEGEED